MKHIQIILISAGAVCALFSTSCATTRGFGQDLQKVGDRIETRADQTGGATPTAAATPAAVATPTGVAAPTGVATP